MGLLAILLIALIVFSRIYLGIHYLSDLLAGSAVAVAGLLSASPAWTRRVGDTFNTSQISEGRVKA